MDRSQYQYAVWAGPGKVQPTQLRPGDKIILDVSEGRVHFMDPSIVVSSIFLCRGFETIRISTNGSKHRANLQVLGVMDLESFCALAETIASPGSLQLRPITIQRSCEPGYQERRGWYHGFVFVTQ